MSYYFSIDVLPHSETERTGFEIEAERTGFEIEAARTGFEIEAERTGFEEYSNNNLVDPNRNR